MGAIIRIDGGIELKRKTPKRYTVYRGSWSYECYQNTNYFPALVKEYVILDVQLDPLDGLQCFQIYQIQIDIKKLAFIHGHCLCIPRTRISFFLDEGQEVPGDKVLLHPRDDTLAPQNPKIQILR